MSSTVLLCLHFSGTRLRPAIQTKANKPGLENHLRLVLLSFVHSESLVRTNYKLWIQHNKTQSRVIRGLSFKKKSAVSFSHVRPKGSGNQDVTLHSAPSQPLAAHTSTRPAQRVVLFFDEVCTWLSHH